jgi:hypothetical protein
VIFVDTGAFLARYLPADSLHKSATALWNRLASEHLCTSNHVLDEVLTLLARRASYSFAAERAGRIYASTAMEIIQSTREDEIEALRDFRKFADQRVSFTDCVSFSLMRRRLIREVFSFDEHFLRAGFRFVVR